MLKKIIANILHKHGVFKRIASTLANLCGG
jgi:hypothetical protein